MYLEQSLTPQQKEVIEKITNEISDVILNKKLHPYQCGLLDGLSGDLLFLFLKNKYDTKTGISSLISESAINERLNYLQDNLAFTKDSLNFGAGLSGQAWLLEYFNQDDPNTYDEELCEEIDQLIHQYLTTDTWHDELEMILGLGGLAIYAARRLRKSPNPLLYCKILSHFESTAYHTDDGLITWIQPKSSVFLYDNENTQNNEINLGLAHGVPGIIAAILPALAIDSLKDKVATLLIKSCNWLLKQELTESDRTSCFATLCNQTQGTRLGWCYGDLTIALTLARVGKALNHDVFITKAREICLLSTNKNAEEGMIRDAGLCHGSAGLSLIFQILHKELGDEELLAASHYWLDFTLNLYTVSGLKGLYKFAGETENYEEDTGLLMGYCGIGLSLLSTLGEESDWVDSLLLA